MLRGFIGKRPSMLSCSRKLALSASNTKLRTDIKSLGITLGEAIKADDPSVFEAVEKLRQLGREVCQYARVLNLVTQKVKHFSSVSHLCSGAYRTVTRVN